jgi:hypothetical protein
MAEKRQLSLSELQNELAHWRSHRQPRSIPAEIQEQAVRLLNQHRPCEIKAALNINHRTLKRWKQQCADSASQRCHDSPPAFISLPTIEPARLESHPDEALALSKPTLKITHHGVDGSSLSVEATLSWAQWRSALSLLTGREVHG